MKQNTLSSADFLVSLFDGESTYFEIEINKITFQPLKQCSAN